MRQISILGSTGSIGVSTLALLDEVAKDHPFRIRALVGGKNSVLLAEQAKKYRPELCVINDPSAYLDLKARLTGQGIEIACGPQAIIEAASLKVDWVMAAIVGIAGLKPTWAAAGTGAVIALANKESLVGCGRALIERAKASGGRILPVDSEHNAIFQVLDLENHKAIKRLILTASGGPFRGFDRKALETVSVEQALKHPNWSMGSKITIDSATLANKGLEWIEAAYLFETDAIDVVIHPQSIIHSMIEYQDGSILAQMGAPDMRIPISACWQWPRRTPWQAPSLDFTSLSRLDFHLPDLEAFPMLKLAQEAYRAGPYMPIVFNAANEVAVECFLNHRLSFLEIAHKVEMAMMKAQLPSKGNFDADLSSDARFGGSHIDQVLLIDGYIRDLVRKDLMPAS